MKRLLAAIATTFFATSVIAATDTEVYGGLAKGNTDLSSDWHNVSAMQPGVGDSFDRYHGWADNNPDIFKGQKSTTPESYHPDIYQGFAPNSDL